VAEDDAPTEKKKTRNFSTLAGFFFLEELSCRI
jgi:hypothetical protein